jgi:hypothetical protein
MQHIPGHLAELTATVSSLDCRCLRDYRLVILALVRVRLCAVVYHSVNSLLAGPRTKYGGR